MIDRVSNVVFSIKMWQNIINGCVCFKKMTPDHKAILSTFIHKKREQIEYLHNGVELIFKSQRSWITAPTVWGNTCVFQKVLISNPKKQTKRPFEVEEC